MVTVVILEFYLAAKWRLEKRWARKNVRDFLGVTANVN